MASVIAPPAAEDRNCRRLNIGNPFRNQVTSYNVSVPEFSPIRCEVHYSGRVQGVGFRWNAHSLARGFPVTGFVRNLPNGSVQLVVEGDRGDIERLLAAIADSMAGNIRHAETTFGPVTGEFQSFDIVN